MAKKAYRVRNWKDYNKSLVSRGSITLWFSENVQTHWNKLTKKDHGNRRYSDTVILTALTLRQLYRLSLRSTQGLMESLISLMKLRNEMPCYTTMSRRGRQLKVSLNVQNSKEARHVLVDSTGIQIVGEGEWKKLRHGESRHQVWRKLHIAMDARDHTILAATVTKSVSLDGNYLPTLINEIAGPIEQITGDGAYDKRNCYETAHLRGAKPVFPPQHNACVQRNKYKKSIALKARDRTIEEIGRGKDRLENLKNWKEKNNYHRRSLIETAMSRMKTLFGDQLRSRTFENQKTDLMIRCYVINKLNKLGLPMSELRE